MKPINADKNALDATKALLDFSKVPATRLGLREALWQHPDFPSLNSLSDVLNEFQVPNLTTRLTPELLYEIPLPALTYLNIDGGMLAPLRSVNGSVEWLHTQRGWQKESVAQFSQKWSGIALLIEPNDQSGQRNYAQNRRREILDLLRVVFVVGAVIAILGILISTALRTFPWTDYSAYYLLGIIKLVGTIVSGMLVWYSLDTKNEFLQKVCQINGRSDCRNILSSSAAKLTGWLSWAEVGLFYFVGGLLALASGLWVGNSEHLILLGESLYLLTLLALPYTFWSVYFQWRVAREWCILCITVQTLLWAELYIMFGHFISPVEARSWLADGSIWKTGLFSFLVTPILLTWVKPYLQKAVSYSPLFKEFQKLKFDPNYLEGLFRKSRILPPVFKGMKVINLGKNDAKNTLIVVASPTCATCRRNHEALKRILENYNELQIKVIFAATLSDGDVAGKVARQILDLSSNADMESALSLWFEMTERQYEVWVEKIDGNYQSEEAADQLIMH